ncbi:unnamed protein product [Lymnaea stagnalis]|uniref:ADP-ribosyl cyclase/cyclic ADP-ribose hydrolase n=1 Tax=Lymnaea stagnalis TaxID=6523 RepID=A0AAV2I124_LYMST
MGLLLLLPFFGVVCLVAGQSGPPGTTPNIQYVFEGRCWDYDETRYNGLLPRVQADCDTLWKLFFQSFSYHAPCAVNQTSYSPFLQAARQTLPQDKVMFWSGVYSLAHRFSENGVNYITLEDTLIGYLANSLVWCGQENPPGMNYSRCPDWSDCPSEASESFWAGASRTFASAAKGNVTLMVDGSNPNKPAYRRNSFFSKYELPSLDVSLVPALHVIVVHTLDKPKIETCGSGTLLDLKNDVTARGILFTCDDDPASVMHLLCADQPDSRECKLAAAHVNCELPYNSTQPGFNGQPDFLG